MARKRRTAGDRHRLEALVRQHIDGLVAELSTVIRASIGEEALNYFNSGGGSATRTRRRTRRSFGCIAPGCNNDSKGPRFHYLCDKHKDAPKKDYDAWRAAKKEKAARKAG